MNATTKGINEPAEQNGRRTVDQIHEENRTVVLAPQYNHSVGGYTYAGARSPQKCFHAGTKPLWTLPNGHSVYAAQESELAAHTGHGVIVDCTGYANKLTPQARDAQRAQQNEETLVFDGTDHFATLRDFVLQPTPRVHIAWPDGGEPPLTPAFWERLLVLANGSICVCCFGSHGRTGTALASLYMAQHGPACTDLTLAEVVATIRRKHCDQAIETYSQVEYLETVADYYGVIITDEHIAGSYHTFHPPVSFTAKGADTGATTRAVAGGRDVATGIPVSASMPNGKTRRKARKATKGAKGGA